MEGLVMKKILLLGVCAAALCGMPALAADLPTKPVYKAAPAPVPMFTWNGCYVGANIGGAWARADASFDVVGFPNQDLGHPNRSGWAGGLQTGCDVQSGNWVFGLEGMWDWTSGSTSRNGTTIAGGFPFSLSGDPRHFATLTARTGWAVDRSLLYVKAGGAWAGMDNTLNVTAGGVGFSWNTSSSGSGWVVGAGWEYAFAPNWSMKIEYDYMGFGNRDNSNTVLGPVANLHISGQSIQTLLVGLNYRWDMMGKAPVAARY
jgi:outer membrane immunogenic protein